MYKFLKSLFFPEKALKKIKKKTDFKEKLNDPKKLSRPLFGDVEVLDFNFDKEILKQDKNFQEMAIFQKVNQTILSNLCKSIKNLTQVDYIISTMKAPSKELVFSFSSKLGR